MQPDSRSNGNAGGKENSGVNNEALLILSFMRRESRLYAGGKENSWVDNEALLIFNSTVKQRCAAAASWYSSVNSDAARIKIICGRWRKFLNQQRSVVDTANGCCYCSIIIPDAVDFSASRCVWWSGYWQRGADTFSEDRLTTMDRKLKLTTKLYYRRCDFNFSRRRRKTW